MFGILSGFKWVAVLLNATEDYKKRRRNRVFRGKYNNFCHKSAISTKNIKNHELESN
jgi:hypothetical protein